jgi:hypothetical protein
MVKQKKLSNKTGDSVEIKEDGKDVTVTVQYKTKLEPMKSSSTHDNFNDMARFMKRQALPKTEIKCLVQAINKK